MPDNQLRPGRDTVGERTADDDGASLDVLRVDDLSPSRPPGSVAEHEAGEAVAGRLRHHGLPLHIERTRVPTSPTWAPLLRALLRLWSAAFLVAGWPNIALGLAAASTAASLPRVAGYVRFVPLLGSGAHSFAAMRIGADDATKPLVVVAHLDTHPTQGAPLRRLHRLLAAGSTILALTAAAVATRPGIAPWRTAAVVVAGESVVTMVLLAARELRTPTDVPDDNTSGLLALARVADLIADGSPPARDVWLVASAAGTTGSYGFDSFLRTRPSLRDAWVVEIDALGTGEVVASPCAANFPRPGTPAPLVRSVVAAARDAGEPLAVRRVHRAHSEARAALRRRVGAITLTAGLHPPAGGPGPDAANAERAARIVDALARTAV